MFQTTQQPKEIPILEKDISLPRNKWGAIDEWKVIEHQKQRSIDSIIKEEEERKRMAKKLYRYCL